MTEVHFRYGGSTATRTLNCADWANQVDTLPKGKVSIAASAGTLMHRMFEKMMNDADYDPEADIGQKHTIDGNQLTVKEEYVGKVWNAIEVQENFALEQNLKVVHTECTFEHSDIIGGSADVVAWNKENNVFAVGDLKTGDGHMVDAYDNDQLLFYAWLAVNHYAKDFTFDGNTRILLYIIQPSERRQDPLDVWAVNLGDLISFGKEFELAVRVSEGGQSDPTPGDWCLWCPKAAVCPAKNALVTTANRMDLEAMDKNALAKGMSIVEEVEQWCKAIRKMAHDQLEDGQTVEGWKLVPKRASRVWANPTEAEAKFHNARKLKQEDYMEMDLKSPAKMEKACKAIGVDFAKYADLVTKVSSGTTLAQDDDPRDAALPLTGMANAIADLS